MHVQSNSAIVLRKIGGRFDALWSATGLRAGGAAAASRPAPSIAGLAVMLCLMLVLPVLVLAGAALLLRHGHVDGALALATAPAAAPKRALSVILAELKKIQTDYTGKAMPEDVGKKFEELAQEAKAMQDEADRERQIKSFERFSREVPDPALPAEGKAAEEQAQAQVAGYVDVGTLYTNSEVFRKYLAAGAPQGFQGAAVELKGVTGRKFVPLSVEQRKAVETALRESKAVPTFDTGVIAPQRLSEIVRVTEQDQLRLRDVINTSTTSQNSVEFVRLESFTRAASVVAEQASKPEAAAAFDVVTATVRTLAVWIPVTEQQIQDVPQLIDIINNELLYDLDKVVEEEVMYGPGTGQHFLGILADPGVVAGRTVSGDTNLDKIRRSMTDVRVSGYDPNAVAIHPIDWENIVLLKGTDDRYVWTVVTTSDGGDRIWGLRVVETIATEAVAGDDTEARNIVVGDFLRGATLWDRQQSTIALGWINDQFIKNMRTIRAERRAAFGVKRPKAFRKIQTVAAVP